jgi:hypothetical protein
LGRDTITLLKRDHECENEHVKLEWLDHAIKGTVVYAVIKRTAKRNNTDTTYVHDADGSYRFIAVFLTTRRGEPGHNFGYKAIAESSGPCERDCPQRLLNLASPFRDDYAGFGRQWREDCRTKRQTDGINRSKRPKPGQTFRTLKPVTFTDGTAHSEFTCIQVQGRRRKRTAYSPTGSKLLYAFRPERYGFEIINPQTKPENGQ